MGDWVAEQARQINPNAMIILNTHSKATRDARRMNLSRFDRVILASDQGKAREIDQLARRYQPTHFMVITGDRDFNYRELRGLMSVSAPNLTVITLKSGGLMPTTVHGQVTDPTYRGTFEIKTASGIQRTYATLGSVVQQSPLLSPSRTNPSFGSARDVMGLISGRLTLPMLWTPRIAPSTAWPRDPGGVLITTTNQYGLDTTGMTQHIREALVQKPEEPEETR